MEAYDVVGLVILGIVALGAIAEVGLLVYAYVNADEVKCNLLWCEFTDVRSVSVETSMIQSRTCYVNGVLTNCSEMP